MARLAIPAFFTLIAEPLFLMTDSAVVGHLGTTALAALGAASAILLSATGVFVFLAYATTAVVARHVGAGRQQEAIQAGLDGVWLAIILSLPLSALLAIFAHPLVNLVGDENIEGLGADYLRISAAGVPAMLICLALQGLLRGLQDTQTPFWVTTVGFALNAGLNATAVLILGWGLSGSATGTVITQWLMAVTMLVLVIRRARHLDLRPQPGRVLASARVGFPLLIRTAALRTVLLVTSAVAGSLGTTTLAAHQVASTIFTFLTFALDAIAIAAQALIGESLGRGETDRTRALTNTMVRWGWWSGVAAGVLTFAGAWVLPHLFASDAHVRQTVTAALLVIAIGAPLSGVLFVLDGVLMGAGDGVFLARTQVTVLLVYLPVIFGVAALSRHLHGVWPLVALWAAYSLNLTGRCYLLDRRRRGDAWTRHPL